MRLFINMMWHAIGIVILFLIIAIWFVDPKGPFILGILFGTIAITLILMMVMKIASRSLGRILIQATEFKEETFILMFSCGYGVIMLAVALTYFFFIVCFMIFKCTEIQLYNLIKKEWFMDFQILMTRRQSRHSE